MVQSTVLSTLPPNLPRLAGAATRVSTSAIRDLLAVVARPDIISLAGGLPAAEEFPVAALAAAAAAELAPDDGQHPSLQYSETEGYPPLRAWVADHRGASVPEILITQGAQQALDLVIRATVDPGTPVVLADPAYVGAVQALRVAGAELVGVPADPDGLRVDVLADRLRAGLRPALAYVVSNFDNPSGAVLTDERRRELARLADHYGFWIVDDDPYRDLRWGPPLPAPLRAVSDRVITLGSFSKVLSPGLRVGYAVGPAELIRSVVLLKQATDLHTGSLTQRMAHRVVSQPGFLAPHLERLAAVYGARAAALSDALVETFGDRLEFCPPHGGMFIWARFREDVDTRLLLARAIDRGVAFVPGAAFSAGADLRRCMRLSFATRSPGDLREACARVRSAYEAT